jgi:hypothetical protein
MPAVLAVIVCSIQWFLIGYALTYSEGGPIFGGLKYAFHRNVLAELVGTIPAILFSFFQLVFQATVCATAVGGACERGRPLVPFIFVCESPVPKGIDVPLITYSSDQHLSTIPWLTWSGVAASSWIWASWISVGNSPYYCDSTASSTAYVSSQSVAVNWVVP